MEERKLKLYISMSVDGFIATKDDDLSWLSIAEKEGEDYGYAAFTKDVDTYIVGRRTYEVVLKLCEGKFPPAEKFDCYVISREERAPENGVQFYNGDLEKLVYELKQRPGGTIYCDGGGAIVKLLMAKSLIDEYIIFMMPTMLGDGIRLFQGGVKPIGLKALEPKFFEAGVVRLHYVNQ
ncbi:dihydrofolate reductase family protein [Persicobacter diffluens]|uniref:Dihydrofolate reductase n=1 Tax=Persicobacter diffluens TaxID=981 RepID=A0AAN4VVU1_9BACT|nr:dihydrofolate reductase [Persicobacter diffluens]